MPETESSSSSPVALDGGELGSLDMHEWLDTIHAVDERRRRSDTVDGLGMIFALLAAGCYGGYTVAAKKLMRAGRPVEGVIVASLLGGALILTPALGDVVDVPFA
jgi:drug/metabolite transporter (DMT)-like permease